MQACLSEREFACRSANYDTETGECSLSDLDRAAIVPTHDMKMRTYGPSGGSVEYIENNCIEGNCIDGSDAPHIARHSSVATFDKLPQTHTHTKTHMGHHTHSSFLVFEEKTIEPVDF